mgnify:CR=1 FL=1
MTSTRNNLNYGPPPPITELTLEQDLQMRKLEISLNSGKIKHEDIVTVFLAMQRQNFVMGNSIKNLIDKWPKVHPTINEVPAMFGILLENRD